jgi:hypothetical protein
LKFFSSEDENPIVRIYELGAAGAYVS